MKQNIHVRWFHYMDSLELLKQKYIQFPNLSQLCAHVLSLIYFYSANEDQSVDWALKSKSLLNIQERSIYTDTIMTIIVDTYIKNKNRKDSAMPDEIFAQFQEIVELILKTSFDLNLPYDKKILVGLAVETEKFGFIEQYLKSVNDVEITKVFNQISELVSTHNKKEEIYRIFFNELKVRPSKNYQLISNCLMNLKLPEEHSQILVGLLKEDVELGYQLLVDIEETGDLFYIN